MELNFSGTSNFFNHFIGLSISLSRTEVVLGKENFGNINPEIIPTKKVVICVDNDGKSTYLYTKDGTNKIIESVKRLEEKGFDVLLSIPKNLPNKMKTDLNDILLSKGDKVLKQELNSLITLKDYIILCDKENKIIKENTRLPAPDKYGSIKKVNPMGNYDISQSKFIKDLKIEAIKMQNSLNDFAKESINKSVTNGRELEREL